MDIHLVPLPPDNYAYLLRDDEGTSVGVVDPGSAGPIRDALATRGWTLTHIFATHHHRDHIGGVDELAASTGAAVIASALDRDHVPSATQLVGEGDKVAFGTTSAQVLFIPGHTTGHIAYHFAAERAVFTGDTLFALGCGRLLGGTAAQLWDSLSRLRALPDDTRVFCGHEYTASNARFALSVDPDNPALKAYADEVTALRAEGRPTIPATIGRERAANPFLRADDAGLQAVAGLAGRPPVEVFAELRARKDVFRG